MKKKFYLKFPITINLSKVYFTLLKRALHSISLLDNARNKAEFVI